MLTDTHCHLDFESYDNDRDLVLARSREAGIVRILNPAIDLASSQTAIKLTEKYEFVFAAVGIHPNEAITWGENTLNELEQLAGIQKVVAIGEIGLDYYWDRTPHDLQRNVFVDQLELAMKVGLPAIIHIRDKDQVNKPALKEVVKILETWVRELKLDNSSIKGRPGVLHSFSGDALEAQIAVDLGFKIGITGPVTFKNAETVKEIVKSLPLEVMLTETDAPFLTPHPHRGERNEPGYVRFISDQIAHLRGIEPRQVSDTTTVNAERLFLW